MHRSKLPRRVSALRTTKSKKKGTQETILGRTSCTIEIVRIVLLIVRKSKMLIEPQNPT